MKKNHLYSWRAYANDGAGFSIGFKKEFFCGVSQLDEAQVNAPSFGRCKVYYNFNELEEHIYYLVQTVHEDLKSEDPHLQDTDEARAIRLKIAKYFVVSLLPFLSAIKNDSYHEEHEHRIYTSKPKSVSLQTFYTPGGNVNEPHLNSKKRIYFQFDLDNISEIWVGPKLNFEHAKHDIVNLLESLKGDGNNINDIKIIPSGIPYKNR